MRTLRMLYSSSVVEEKRARRRVSNAVRQTDRDVMLYCFDVDMFDVEVETPLIAVDDDRLLRGVPHRLDAIEDLLG